MINKRGMDDKSLRMIRREVSIMKMLHHRHIVQLWEVMEADNYLFLVMEYASGGEV